jgi:hypothetical protein
VIKLLQLVAVIRKVRVCWGFHYGDLLLESRQLLDLASIDREHQGVPVKDELIIATNRVAIIDRYVKSLSLSS